MQKTTMNDLQNKKHRLLIMRHAEAAHAAESDRARPLTSKGKNDALLVAQRLTAYKINPDYVLCSPARRTRETYDAMAKALPETSVIYPEYLYQATAERLFDALSMLSESSNQVLLIAHNPGVQGLVSFLAKKGDHEMQEKVSYSYRPATLSVIDCVCETWLDLKPDINKLETVIVP